MLLGNDDDLLVHGLRLDEPVDVTVGLVKGELVLEREGSCGGRLHVEDDAG